MTKPNPTDHLIASLTAELNPVRALRRRDGFGLTFAAVAFTISVVLAWLGLRPELLGGEASGMFVIANGLILLLGLAAAATVVRMGSPQVGNRHEGWKWALAMAALLPLAASVRLALHPGELGQITNGVQGPDCMVHALVLSSFTALALTLWLRRGAPASPPLAGLLTGLAAGALGTFAYGLACPVETIYHLGVWHCLPIVIAALVGRFGIARLITW